MAQRGPRAGAETGSVVNHISSGQGPEIAGQITPGDGATILHWTDRTAATVIAVRPGKRPEIEIQEDRAIRTDGNGLSDQQSYRYERDPAGRTHTVSYRRGAWRVRGSDNGVRFGARDHFWDPSF
jgi:hypothetical protein